MSTLAMGVSIQPMLNALLRLPRYQRRYKVAAMRVALKRKHSKAISDEAVKALRKALRDMDQD